MNKKLIITIAELGISAVAGFGVGRLTVNQLGGLKKLNHGIDKSAEDIPEEELDLDDYSDCADVE